jgi:predicted small secreted protein
MILPTSNRGYPVVKRIVFFVVTVAIAVSAAGCNTFHGIGRDIQRAGEGIQNATTKDNK